MQSDKPNPAPDTGHNHNDNDNDNDKVIDMEPIAVDGKTVWARTEPASLDQIRTTMLAGQAAAEGLDIPQPPERVVVDPTGTISLVPRDEPVGAPLAEVTQEVFASDRPSLDRIRDQMLQAQGSGAAGPQDPRQKIVADRNGRIGFEEDLSDGRALSEVTQEVFAARVETDRQTVAQYLPSTTREVDVDGITGWTYRFQNEFGEWFAMWAFFDGTLYQAVLVEPQAESRSGMHDKHLFSDGYLCLSPRGGCKTLRDTYARSVMWANGYTTYKQTGKFPFSINNL